MADEDSGDLRRLDKWLWHVRFYKTRSLASAAIRGGKAHLNGERVKPAHVVRVGDRVSLALQGIVAEFAVLGLPVRRGPATEAQTHYAETEARRVQSAGRSCGRISAWRSCPGPARKADRINVTGVAL